MPDETVETPGTEIEIIDPDQPPATDEPAGDDTDESDNPELVP